MDTVRVADTVVIPDAELDVGFSRAGGPGGQHVNTSATKVELRFDVDGSPSLTDEQKARLRTALGHRITKDGVLVLQASEHRSQARNREAVLARFRNLVGDALAPPKPSRRRTGPSRAARERRLREKKERAETKRLRKPPES